MALPSILSPAVEALVAHLGQWSAGDVVGLYLFGSATSGGLRPDSDIDLLLVTAAPLTDGQRAGLTRFLLERSGRWATVQRGRPLELTAVTAGVLRPWRYSATRDYRYGEWLRDEAVSGGRLGPEADPDLAVLITAARESSRVLIGPPLRTISDPVPRSDVRTAIHDCLEPLLTDLPGDERNVLLTLARMVVTLDTGEIVPKDVAAARVAPELPSGAARLLEQAGLAYRGEVVDAWEDSEAIADLAAHLADRVRRG